METIVEDLKKFFFTLVKGFGSGSALKVGSGSASKRSGFATLPVTLLIFLGQRCYLNQSWPCLVSLLLGQKLSLQEHIRQTVTYVHKIFKSHLILKLMSYGNFLKT